ncbi:MAG: hypothetical protein RL139_1381 [Gemmatimonadota bacterium]|jgi:ring-1,2-phenylacetyl-CoA epoxidase subunit PaaC
MAAHEEELGIAAGEAAAGRRPVAGPSRTPVLGAPLVEYLLRLGDDRLILGHRLSEWCGHGPILEEDIALSNMALDLIGQAAALLRLAGEAEGQGRDEDALAYWREAVQFRNALITELPNGDFGVTIVRQFLVSAHSLLLWEALLGAPHEGLAGVAAKAVKEVRYHVRHSGEWVVRLGDGTPESQARVQRAVDDLWRYTGELFDADAVDAAVAALGIVVDHAALKARWDGLVDEVLARATLVRPADGPMRRGGRVGRHTEHLGHLLSVMQSVTRAHPGATW